MTDSKAYLSFVLLLAFLLSAHVLTHELPKVGTRAEGDDQYAPLAAGYKPRDYQWPPGHWSPPRQHETEPDELAYKGALPPPILAKAKAKREEEKLYRVYTKSPVTPPPIPTKAKAKREEEKLYRVYAKSPGGTTAEVDQYTPMAGSKPRDIQWPPGHWSPPRQHKTEKDHYTHSIGYRSSMGLQSTFSSPDELASKETRNHEDGTVMRDRKMTRPSETDWKSFHAFSTKSSRMTDGDKTGYNGAPNMEEEVGEETVN